ncbi:MAG: FG-GAP-like repeat-containing protein [Planctomycetota bacterium]|jgi:hypothetical protein
MGKSSVCRAFRPGALSLSTVVAAIATMVPSPSAHAQPAFADQTNDVGLTATHVANQFFIPGGQWWMSGGMALGDFDNDGHTDVFWLGGGAVPDRLFINDGDGTFTDRAGDWGVASVHCGIGASVADYDGDGWLDIYVTTWGDPDFALLPGQHRLYRNIEGTSFTNVAGAAGVSFSSSSDGGGYGSAWGDYDLDGDLDLFVAHWHITAEGNRFYRNDGDGTFTDVTETALGSLAGVWGFQPAFTDMNGDLFPELLLVADFSTSRYYVNNGDGTFTDQTGTSGTGLDDHGMGSTVADVNNDGLLDWYVTSIHDESPPDPPPAGFNNGNMLYIATGAHVFDQMAETTGCNDGGWGWGTDTGDLDNDGWIDIVETNGRPNPSPGAQWNAEPAKLFHNRTTVTDGPLTFEEVALDTGFVHAENGTSITLFDPDDDGDLDILSFANTGPTQYFENLSTSGSWLRVRLDTSTNELLAPNGFNTSVTASAGGVERVRYQNGRPNYLGTGDLDLHFGLGEAAVVDELTIRWARGQVTVLTQVAVDQIITITAPALADLNQDGTVGFADLLQVISAWGTCAVCPADLNADGQIGFGDVLVVIANWGI